MIGSTLLISVILRNDGTCKIKMSYKEINGLLFSIVLKQLENNSKPTTVFKHITCSLAGCTRLINYKNLFIILCLLNNKLFSETIIQILEDGRVSGGRRSPYGGSVRRVIAIHHSPQILIPPNLYYILFYLLNNLLSQLYSWYY